VDWQALSARDRLAVVALAPSLWRARRWAQGANVDLPALFSRDETVEEWLVRHGQTPRVRQMLWEPLALAALNQDVRSAAAGPFVRVLGGVFGRDSRDASIAIPAVPLDELYVEPARQDLERRRGEVRVNALARVVLEASGPRAVEVRGQRLEPRAVIVAVPWHDLPSVFRGATDPIANVLRAAAGTPASPIVTVNLWFDRSVLDTAFVGLPGRVMQWVFDKSATSGDGTSRLSLVSSGAADVFRRSSDDLIAIGVEEVREALPGARHAAVVRASVVREPNATFSLAPGSPARPATRTAVPGLFLAGDWVDTELPATIESAVVSGHRAAEAARGYLEAKPGA